MKSLKNFSCLAFLILSIHLISCQKEVEGVIEDDNNTTEDSIFLKRALFMDSTLPSGQDTGIVYLYDYDAKKRVVRLTVTEFDLPTKYTLYYQMYYNGSDSLPYKFTTTTNFDNDSLITFLTYSNGFVVKDSTATYENNSLTLKETSFVTALGNNLYQVLNYSDLVLFPGNVLVDSITFTRNVVNNNVISGTDSVWIPSVGIPDNIIRYQNTFDNKRNPFANLSVWYLGYYHKLITETVSEGSNNALHYEIVDQAGVLESVNVSYSYDSNGYPLIGRGDGDLNKAIFEYVILH